VGNIGNEINNVAKLSSLEKGIIIGKNFNYKKLIIDGNSKIVILKIKNPTKWNQDH